MVNYCLVSLLPICGKIFERLIFNPFFEFLEENKLLSPNQSGFRPNDSCENLLLSIVHSIYADFDQCPSLEVRANFLDKLLSCLFKKIYCIPFLNGTNLTQTCAMLNHTQHSENCSWRLVGQAQIIFTKSMIL